jgi:DNA-binding MarR family transcriptional regulator
MADPRQEDYEDAATLRIALRGFLARSEEVTREHGLTPERYELLLLVKAAPEGKATVGELAKLLSVGQSAATQLVRRAEDAGLVERTISRSDARVHPLRLTPEGERRLASAVAALEAERTTLRALLGREQAFEA